MGCTVKLPIPIKPCCNKVTIRPGFPGTVPIFNLQSQKKSQVSRDAHLSRFRPGVPDLSRLKKSLRDEHGKETVENILITETNFDISCPDLHTLLVTHPRLQKAIHSSEKYKLKPLV